MSSSSPDPVRRIAKGDAEYPARLLELHDPPAQLWAMGALPHADAPAVAIVGARNASPYGVRMARAIANACARAGVSVISGLARGIDGAGHEAALAAGGRTVAVLGTGFGVVYPKSHRALQERIARDGLLLSELEPDSTGHRGSFPQRNRIIAALADVTVVVEAREGSGSLITADFASELGRSVATVPNAVDVVGARGSNALLRSGAQVILSPDDVLSLLSVAAAPLPAPALDDDAASCWDAVRAGASNVGEVARLSGLSPRAAAAAVSQLEIEGLLVTDGIALRPAPALLDLS